MNPSHWMLLLALAGCGRKVVYAWEPAQTRLEGRLSSETFAGPGGPEVAWMLELAQPIHISVKNGEPPYVSLEDVRFVQVVGATSAELASLDGSRVTAEGRLAPAEAAGHHTQVILRATRVAGGD